MLRYTRNGKLLGDGFLGVYESNLVPVVGFHSNGESVRVNFGVSPFLYEVRLSTSCPGRGGGLREVVSGLHWEVLYMMDGEVYRAFISPRLLLSSSGVMLPRLWHVFPWREVVVHSYQTIEGNTIPDIAVNVNRSPTVEAAMRATHVL